MYVHIRQDLDMPVMGRWAKHAAIQIERSVINILCNIHENLLIMAQH